jgi:ABC-type antimicrobial peptide transport system ATPase subunit
MSTIRDAEPILVMRDGDIVERGNHDELLSKGEFYAEYHFSFTICTNRFQSFIRKLLEIICCS